MGTGALQNRTAQRHECASIRVNLRLYTHNFTIFIAAHGKVHFKMMAFGMNQKRFFPGQL